MKRLTISLLIAFLTFLLGIGLTVFLYEIPGSEKPAEEKTSNEKVFQDEGFYGKLPVLTLCEVIKNADQYDGKTIRLKATVNSSNHGEYLSLPHKCLDRKNLTDVFDSHTAFRYVDASEYKKVTDFRMTRNNKQWAASLIVTGVGKFRKNEARRDTSSNEKNSSYHFTLISLDSIVEEWIPEPVIENNKYQSIFVEPLNY